MAENIASNYEVRSENLIELGPGNEGRIKRRNYKQIYRKEWETNPVFKGWLSPVSCDKYKAVCIACKKELLAHRLTLLKHASSAKHLKKLELLNKTTSLLKYQANDNNHNTFGMNNESPHDHDNSNSLAELDDLENVTVTTLEDVEDKKPRNCEDKGFSSEMIVSSVKQMEKRITTNDQEMLSHEKSYDCSNVASSTATENLELFIQTETYVNISNSQEAINFKPGYVAKNSNIGTKTNAGILSCASAFLNDKMNEDIEENVLSKITTYPLQVSTRVTDYSRGLSVSTMNVALYQLSSGKWMCVSESVTDEVGRCNFFPKSESFFPIGCYKLHYSVASYYEMQSLKSYFPFIEIFFLIRSPNESHHIPLMISPNGYTVYRSLDF